jgi:hypothetical protein
MKTFLALTVAALAAAPAALAAGGPLYAQVGGTGVASPSGKVHYVPLSAGSGRTMLVTVSADGSVWNGSTFAGDWGVPMIGYQTPVGISRDGRRLVLQSLAATAPTHFLVVDLRRMRVVDRFTLHGAFSFDALSPDGATLYLTDRVDASNQSRYVVRAYDLRSHTLRAGRIADRTQKSWVMEGDALTRAVGPGGRWVYTLYTNPGGTPFVHALDTVRGVAHCIGIPWTRPDQNALFNVVLAVRGDRLDVHWRSGKPWLRVDTGSWRISAATQSGFPWAWLGLLALPLPLWLARRRRPGGTLLPREA